MGLRRLEIWLVVLVAASPAAFSMDASPARFGDLREAFAAEFNPSELPLDSGTLVRCGAGVTKRGRLQAIVCYDNESTPEAARKIADQVRAFFGERSNTLIPATVQGKAKDVWMNFSVHLSIINDKYEVELFENHMLNSAAYGKGYIAAQRFDRVGWGCDFKRGEWELIVARVSADGELRDVRSTDNERGCRKRILGAFKRSKFIPAKVNDIFVDSLYSELFYTRR